MTPDFVGSLTETLPRMRYALGDLTGRNLIGPDQETYELMRGLLFALLREDS